LSTQLLLHCHSVSTFAAHESCNIPASAHALEDTPQIDMFCQLHDTHGIAVGMQEGACIVCGQHTAKAKRAHLELIWQILGEPGVGLDACNGDPVGRVAHKDLAHHVQALPGDVQVCGEAVLHPHDPLQPCTAHVNFLA